MMKSHLIFGLLSGSCAQDTPGFEYLGYGYDMLQGNPLATDGMLDPGWKSAVFAFTKNEGRKTTDGKWDVPDKTQSQDVENCAKNQDSTVINSFYSYKKEVSTGFNINLALKDVSFGFGIDSDHIRHTTENKQSVFAMTSMLCTVYKLTMNTFAMPPLNENFMTAVETMPENADDEFFSRFFGAFGTHYVWELSLGGRWGWQTEFNYDDYQQMLDDSLDINANIQAMGKVNAGLTYNTSTNLSSQFIQSITKNSTFNTGGKYSKHDPDSWAATVRDAPMPTVLGVLPLHELVTSNNMPNYKGSGSLTAKQAALKNATASYCLYLAKQTSTDPTDRCVPPKPVPPPKPNPVKDDAINGICMYNGGAYMLDPSFWVDGTPKATHPSSFSHGNEVCVGGWQLQAKRGEVLKCSGHAEAGHTAQCEGNGYEYDERSKLQAAYNCDGSTMSIQCHFTGLRSTSLNVDAPSEVFV